MKTDAQIQHDVIAELKWEPAVNAAEVGVEVKDGIVTLAGHVSTYAEKCAAADAAQRVVGVKALAVEMDVSLTAFGVRNDEDIARSVENVIEWLADLPRDSIKVKVEGGWVTLTGEVEWDYQRRAAKDAVCSLLGVSGVSDQVLIVPKTTSPVIKSDIEATMKRRIKADAKHIDVQVHGDEVTLTGTVHDWTERELITRAAWGTPGVRNVHDRLTVVG